MMNLEHTAPNEGNLPDSTAGMVVLRQAIDENPLVFAPEISLRDVILCMSQGSINCADGAQPQEATAPQRVNYVLIMVQQKLLGIFTERDVVRLSAQGIDFSAAQIADVMTQQLITLQESELQHVSTILDLFRQHRIRHLPIMGKQSEVVGVITTDGLRKSL